MNVMLREIELPTACPACDGEIEQYGNSGQIRCISTDCSAQLVRKLIHWASKNAMDIDAIGPTWIEQFVEQDDISNIAHFYLLTEADLVKYSNMGSGRIAKFLESIAKSKAAGMRRVLIGLSIPDCGEGTAKRLCKYFESVEAVANASVAELAMIEDIGLVVASSIVGYFEKHPDICANLRAVGVSLDRLPEDAPLQFSDDAVFAGERVCVTGKLSMARDEMHKLLEQHGAIIASSVSSKTSVLICGASVGSNKTNAAKKHGTKVIDEETALRAMGLL